MRLFLSFLPSIFLAQGNQIMRSASLRLSVCAGIMLQSKDCRRDVLKPNIVI